MSEFYLNNPDFDPSKLKPIEPKFKNGMAREEHERIVAAGLKMLGVSDDQATDIDRLIALSTHRISQVRQWAETLDSETRAAGRSHNPQILYTELVQSYWKQFEDYPKDDLLVVLTMFLAKATMREII